MVANTVDLDLIIHAITSLKVCLISMICKKFTVYHTILSSGYNKNQDFWKPQGLETYFNMHKYTELLTFLTKIRISEYKHIRISLYSEILIFGNVNNLVYLCILKYVSSPCVGNRVKKCCKPVFFLIPSKLSISFKTNNDFSVTLTLSKTRPHFYVPVEQFF